MTREFTRTFSVSVPVERAWSAFTDLDELNKWFFPMSQDDDGNAEFELMGQPMPIELLDVEPPHRLHYSSPFGPWPIEATIETTITFESTDTGTRITLTHSGFGDGAEWEASLNGRILGTDETIADAVLYLETGVALPRHPKWRSWLGIAGLEVPAGVEVHQVAPGSFADKAGLEGGDLIVEVGGIPVFGQREVWFFEREHQPGERAEVAWVRGGQLVRSTAELGPHLAPSPA